MSKIDALAKNKEEEQESTLRSSRYQWYIVIFMGLVGFLDNNLNLMEGQVVPFIIDEYGISNEFFALWQGIFGIATFAVWKEKRNFSIITSNGRSYDFDNSFNT